MMKNPVNRASPSLSLIVERTFPAAREKVFRAWIDPALMLKWFAPVGMTPFGIEADARVGGNYRIGMRERDGSTVIVTGTYLEVTPPTRLVFTWAWQSDPGDSSVVTVEFIERQNATHIVLTHTRITDPAHVESHRYGWEGCLDHLLADLSDRDS